MNAFQSLSIFFKQLAFYSKVNLRNSHKVIINHDNEGDVDILQPDFRFLSRGDALGLIIHLMEKSKITSEDIQFSQLELARVRQEVKKLNPNDKSIGAEWLRLRLGKE